MIVENHKLVYFAFPKCASELLRSKLPVRHDGPECDWYDWSKSDLHYCHCQPRKFIEHLDHWDQFTFFSIIRNPFDRLVSAWSYGREHMIERNVTEWYAPPSFEAFIHRIDENLTKGTFSKLSCNWMYMPVDMYFEGVIDYIKFFKLEEDGISACSRWLEDNYNIVALKNAEKTNTSKHNHYRTYYNKTLRAIVEKHYKYELDRFGYTF